MHLYCWLIFALNFWDHRDGTITHTHTHTCTYCQTVIRQLCCLQGVTGCNRIFPMCTGCKESWCHHAGCKQGSNTQCCKCTRYFDRRNDDMVTTCTVSMDILQLGKNFTFPKQKAKESTFQVYRSQKMLCFVHPVGRGCIWGSRTEVHGPVYCGVGRRVQEMDPRDGWESQEAEGGTR